MRFKFLAIFCLVSLPLLSNPWGKDADLCDFRAKPACAPAAPSGFLVKFSEIMIGFHQEVISPADGPRSHFKPSSSQYTLDAIRMHGFFYGFLLGCDRLMRENNDPWIYRTIRTEDGLETKWNPVP